MEICDIQFIEPTLLYSKKKVKELFKQYVNDDLPEYVLGLHINLTIKTYISDTNNLQPNHP